MLILLAAFLLGFVLVLLLIPTRIYFFLGKTGGSGYLVLKLGLIKGLVPVRLKLHGRMDKTARPLRKKTKRQNNLFMFRVLRPALKHTTAHTRLVEFNWRTRLGWPDAALTGILTGFLWAFKGGAVGGLYRLVKHHDRHPQLHIEPVYDATVLDTELNCIFELAPGHIIIAALKAALAWRRLKQGGEKHARATSH